MQKKYEVTTPDNCVLLMIDYQSGIASISESQDIKQVTESAIRMLVLAKIYNIPVIFTSSEENLERKGEILQPLQTILPDAYNSRIKRTGLINSMSDPQFLRALEKTNRTHLVIGGISTEECVSVPALTALNDDYSVKVIADACCSHSELTDTIQFRRMIHYGVDVTTIRQFAADILINWSTTSASEYNSLCNEYIS